MPYYCTVPLCKSLAGKTKNVSFHQFPRNPELAKLWNMVLKRGKPYTKYSKVCSLHFTQEDYTSDNKNKGHCRTLRKDAIPSQNLPSDSPRPIRRRTNSWGGNSSASQIIDPLQMHHQMTQAFFVQAMLAIQACHTVDPQALNPQKIAPFPAESSGYSSKVEIQNVIRLSDANDDQSDDDEPKTSSYKCNECSKCFKDPDVLLLHRRVHKDAEEEFKENENLNKNITSQSNPILANLLRNHQSGVVKFTDTVEPKVMEFLQFEGFCEKYVKKNCDKL